MSAPDYGPGRFQLPRAAGEPERRSALAAVRAVLAAPGPPRRAVMADVLAAAAAIRDVAERARSAGPVALDVGRPRGAPVARPAAPPLRVFVVDDVDLLRRLVTRQLTAAGHAVVGEAATAKEAVARARTLAPDVLVLDVHLPDGLGTEVAARIAAHATPEPGAVFCTGDPDGAADALAGCGWPVLEKPVPASTLDRAVREAAARRPRF